MSAAKTIEREKAIQEVNGMRRVALAMYRFHANHLLEYRDKRLSWDLWGDGFYTGARMAWICALKELRQTRRWLERMV